MPFRAYFRGLLGRRNRQSPKSALAHTTPSSQAEAAPSSRNDPAPTSPAVEPQTFNSSTSNASVVSGTTVKPPSANTSATSASVPSPANTPVADSAAGTGLVIDTVDLTLGLIEKLGGLFQTVPFIAPIAGVMKEVVTVYKVIFFDWMSRV